MVVVDFWFGEGGEIFGRSWAILDDPPPYIRQQGSWHVIRHVVSELRVAETPGDTYVDTAFLSFFLHPINQPLYHTPYQVMSPNCRAYSLESHLLYRILTIVDLTYHLQVSPARLKMYVRNSGKLGKSLCMRLSFHQPHTEQYWLTSGC